MTFAAQLGEFIDSQVFYNGAFEPSVTSLLRDILRPGQTFIDVGANAGYYSLFAWSQVRPSGQVLALEPDPVSLSRLRTNVLLNPGCGIDPIALALSESDGASTFWGSSHDQVNQGGGTLLGGAGAGFRVATVRLDSLLAQFQLPTVDLLKMDIEGAEGLAIKGMPRSIRDHRVRRMIVEMHRSPLEKMGSSPGELIRCLEGQGYSGYRIKSGQGRGARKYATTANHRLAPIGAVDLSRPLAHYLFVAPGIAAPSPDPTSA